MVEDAGHKIIFSPKFHCELNFIELIWAYIKSKLRRTCDFDFNSLHDIRLPSVIASISPSLVRDCSNHCFRFMSGNRIGLKVPVLDYAMKKYKSHRRLTSSLQPQIRAMYAQHKGNSSFNAFSALSNENEIDGNIITT